MALCSSIQAKGLPVHTASGQDIGRVLGFILDTERGSIVQIEVRPAGLVRSLVAHELLINWNEVIAWTDESITVRDAAIPETSSLAVPSVAPSV
jgi:sporulation protein YlmC with PRC-barrel domain